MKKMENSHPLQDDNILDSHIRRCGFGEKHQSMPGCSMISETPHIWQQFGFTKQDPGRRL
jgi:hypothetical protein